MKVVTSISIGSSFYNPVNTPILSAERQFVRTRSSIGIGRTGVGSALFFAIQSARKSEGESNDPGVEREKPLRGWGASTGFGTVGAPQNGKTAELFPVQP